MVRQFVSRQARRFQRKLHDIRLYINDRYGAMDMDTWEVIRNTLLQNVEEINVLLQRQSVRGHRDPTILTPEVHQRSSKDAIVLRLQRQIDAVSVLADVTHLGPEANEDEAATLMRVDQILDNLFEVITPETSLRGSDTVSN
ncbi:unnamed protein product [Caenorhabditis auriculariae]|uniref:Uncharacterized protein n=1 Tax=Caenorhabditis auriculariae TaxID=2777116 RepID=A0A8S1HCI8_9PELO|nr:unnamed protein product [Caenorhabditis auriculariae]